jgi:hypothetical protein
VVVKVFNARDDQAGGRVEQLNRPFYDPAAGSSVAVVGLSTCHHDLVVDELDVDPARHSRFLAATLSGGRNATKDDKP